ncbi:MAG: 50S ribosomal protein L25 [Candidatus Omnitrophota bacterium]|nr:50S ribosomal protein L25 [Candidatus Omnitrophota bacterium]
MEKVKIETKFREKSGKEIAKKIRQLGEVPAIIYGKDTNILIELPLESLRILKSIHFSESTIINMTISGMDKGNEFPVLIKDIQYHPLTDKVIHVDFLKVSLTEKIKVHVPLVFKGEPEAVKEGAIVEQVIREIEVEGLPLDIPEHLDVDISKLEIGHSLHVKDLAVDVKLKIVTHLDETVATLVSKVEEVEEAADMEGGEVAFSGPEVIKEKKEDKTAQSEKEEKGDKPKK